MTRPAAPHPTVPALPAMSPRRRLASAFLGALAAAIVFAAPAAVHTGAEGTGPGDGFLHPLTGLDHLLVLFSVGVVAAAVGDRRRMIALPGAFLGALLFGGLLGLGIAGSSVIEIGIATSVIALGVVLALRTSMPATWLLATVAIIGALHGLVHGIEAPDMGLPVPYAAGVLSASAAVITIGVVSGAALRRAPLARMSLGALFAGVGAVLLISG